MRSIIYIERNNLYFYGSNVHAPIAFPFQPTIVRDIEVINAEELEKQLGEFIKNNKIEPTETIIVLSHQSSFEKSLPPKTTPILIETEKKHFIENVPFGQILSQTFTSEKGIKIVAANKELAYIIRDIFTKHQFTVEVIASITPISPDTDISFTADSAQQILKKASLLKQFAFPIIDVEVEVTDKFEEGFVQEKKNNNLYIMLVFLVIAIGILVFMYMNQQKERSAKKTKVVVTPQVSARRSSPSPSVITGSPEASPSATSLPKATLTFQILNGSTISGQADDIKDSLEKAGYANVATGNSQTQSSKTLIVYKSRVSPTQITEISNIVSSVVKDVATQQNEDISVDVLITTSQSSTTP